MFKEGLQKVVDKEQSTDAKAQVCEPLAIVQRNATSSDSFEPLLCQMSKRRPSQMIVVKLCSNIQFVQVNMLSADDLRDLVTFREDIRSILNTCNSLTCEWCDAEADCEEMIPVPEM